ncbi:MAG: 5-(carboxyamino)imidazole ribonucleotide synthase [Gammaproteobacteria bacterium]|nr:5-(carboxyamino)imidazole ribonucleotide synthase [Gammaproteobacteria bacterium]
MIRPGATLGMIGGGQLGRMFTVAARTMGYNVIVLDPGADSPAGRVADEHLRAAYTDELALERLTRECAAVTTEFENVPAGSLRQLEAHVPVRPSSRALKFTQDRIEEKNFIRQSGLATADFEVIQTTDDLGRAFESLTPPLILKRAAFGYDGKGQAEVENVGALREAFDGLGNVPCVLERKVDLQLELSIVLARSSAGETRCFPAAENVHRDGILSMSIVPARCSAMLAAQARRVAVTLADFLDYCGVMAVEFFVTREGQLLVNEIAPRPHNSGHYTIDACVTSQFEQQVRMLCDLPLGDVRLLSPVVMVNLLGDLWNDGQPDWSRVFSQPGTKLHLYGKREARPKRKMGHLCCLHEDVDVALKMARGVLAKLGGVS